MGWTIETHISHGWHWATAVLSVLGPIFLLAAAPASGRVFDTAPTVMELGKQVYPPAGFLKFCARKPENCVPFEDSRGQPALELGRVGGVPALVEVTSRPPASDQIKVNADGTLVEEMATWRIIAAIGESINRAISPASDSDNYGADDYWATPLEDGRRVGDCEDYALEKRQALINAGIPRENLALALATTRGGEDHVVLLIRVGQREYVLDNLTDRIVPWNEAPYRWVERQVSGASPQWVAITPTPDGPDGRSYAVVAH